MRNIVDKIHNRILKMSFQPIRVFVFHHVSAECDPLVCQEEDWTQLDQFKHNIERLSQNYTFISLSEAYHKLQHDKIRCHKYAVLTTDDGLASVLNVIPWLEEKKIPLTLFINTRYMERDKLKPVHQKWLHELVPDTNEMTVAKRMYLSKEQIWSLISPYIEIGMHGHEHLNVQQIKEEQFERDINTCRERLSNHPQYVPMYAYPWGCATNESLYFLKNEGIIPVLVGGGKNYKWIGYIDRESIDNKTLKKNRMKSLGHYVKVIRRRIIRSILKNRTIAHFLSKHCLKTYLALFYENWIGKRMNYRQPQDMSQELIKLSYHNSKDEKMRRLIPMCTDKYAVREYIESKGYGDILNDLYGVYDSVDDIEFDALPNQFVMKVTNACGRNWVCTDKSKADWQIIKQKLAEWMKDDDFAWETGEWQYAMIKPRIIVEKYLKDLGEASLVDYKLHVIKGKAYGFFIGYNRDTDIMHDPTKRGVCFDCYTPDWILTEDITPEWHVNRQIIPKPKSLRRMIQIAEECSKEFDYCRFDMYDIDGKVVFGEMTFSPHGGVLNYYTDEYQKKMQHFYHAQS